MKNVSPKISEELKKIPRTGWIGRFAKILEKEIDPFLLIDIMNGSDTYDSLSSDKNHYGGKMP